MTLVEFTIESIVKKYLLSNEYAKLPSERTLCEDIKVSRVTLRRALERLESSGLIYQLPGGRTRFINFENVNANYPDRNAGVIGSNEEAFAYAHGIPGNTANIDDSVIYLRLKAMDLAFASSKVMPCWNSWIQEFVNMHHGIKVKITSYSPGSEQHSQTNDTFDILQCTSSDAYSYLKHDAVQKIESFADFENNYSETRFDSNIYKDCQVKDRLICAPYGTSLACFLGLKKDWQNIAVPAQWTWSEFLDVAEPLAAKKGIACSTIFNPFFFFRSLGLSPFPGYQETDNLADIENLLNRMRGKIELSASNINQERIKQEQILTGNSLTTSMANFDKDTPLILLPYPCEKNGVIGRHTVGLYLAKSTKYPIEANDFIANIVSLKNQRSLAKLYHFIPASIVAQKQYFAQDFPHCANKNMLAVSLKNSEQPIFPQEVGKQLYLQKMFWNDWELFTHKQLKLNALLFRTKQRIQAILQNTYPELLHKMLLKNVRNSS